ncbi:MAG: DUF2252 family protein [Caulobacteraceae bacterium]
MKPPKPDDRAELLGARQRTKMARSAQTYVRGSTARFYDWLKQDGRILPEGPPIWICGDCHYGNLGPVANSKGDVAIQIRDLDQAVIGNPTHDVIRLALSLASAVRGFDLPGVTTARMVEQIVDGYQAALTGPARADEDKPPTVKGLLKTSQKRRWRHLARERIEDLKPAIPLGKRFWRLGKDERDALTALVASAPVHDLITGLRSRPTEAPVELVDAAYWVKGCSSLGLLRYALLVAIAGNGDRELGLIDVKEAVKAAAPRAPNAAMPKDNGARVVEGARHLAPYLGERMRAARLLDRSVFVRELLPQDLKLEISALQADEAVTVARFLAGVVGRAHGRQLDEADRKAWAGELDRNRSGGLDAPSWLWTSVVELMAAHEAAYLDHCRRYARVAA